MPGYKSARPRARVMENCAAPFWSWIHFAAAARLAARFVLVGFAQHVNIPLRAFHVIPFHAAAFLYFFRALLLRFVTFTAFFLPKLRSSQYARTPV